MRKLTLSMLFVAGAFCSLAQNADELFNKTWYEQPHQSDAVVFNFNTTQYLNVPGIDYLQFEEYFTVSFAKDGSFQFKEFDYCPKELGSKPKEDGTSTQTMQAGKWKWIDENKSIMKMKFDGGCAWKVWIKQVEEKNLQLMFKPISNNIQ